MSNFNSKNVNRKARDYTKNVVLLSKKKKGIIAYILILMSLYVSATYTDTQYYSIYILIGLGVLGVLCYVVADTIEVYHDKIEVLSFLGKKKNSIMRNEILKWNEIKKAGKYVTYYVLIVQTKYDKFVISSIRYKNYEEIKNKITHGVSRSGEIHEDFDKRHYIFIYVIFVIGITFLVALFIF